MYISMTVVVQAEYIKDGTSPEPFSEASDRFKSIAVNYVEDKLGSYIREVDDIHVIVISVTNARREP